MNRCGHQRWPQDSGSLRIRSRSSKYSRFRSVRSGTTRTRVPECSFKLGPVNLLDSFIVLLLEVAAHVFSFEGLSAPCAMGETVSTLALVLSTFGDGYSKRAVNALHQSKWTVVKAVELQRILLKRLPTLARNHGMHQVHVLFHLARIH